MLFKLIKFSLFGFLSLGLCSFTSMPVKQADHLKPRANQLEIYQSSEDITSKSELTPGLDNYKTKIIRSKIAIATQTETCEEVLDKVKELFFDDIFSSPEYFSHSTLLHCDFDKETGLANLLEISSYVDPKNEAGARQLDELIADTQGRDLWGKPFTIEEAKEVILSLTLNVGQKEDVNDPVMVVYFTYQSSFLFKSHQEVNKEFVADQKQRFRSRDPKVLFPFFDKWFFDNQPTAEGILSKMLKSANYVHIRVQRNFIMETGERLFFPRYGMNYAHACFKEPNQRCL